jgi:hypothetical protein
MKEQTWRWRGIDKCGHGLGNVKTLLRWLARKVRHCLVGWAFMLYGHFLDDPEPTNVNVDLRLVR